MKFVLPPKKLLLLIFLVSLVNPIHYALLFLFPPENKVFLGYPDDNLMLTLMKSPAWNFEDPWSFNGGKVWHNPLIGSVYLFIFLGIIPLLLNINLYLSFIFFKFVFSVLYYIVVYNLMCYFLKSRTERSIAMLVFMFVAGLGGIMYLTSLLAFPGSQYNSIIGYAFTNEFNELSATGHSLTHTFRLYYMIPEMLGYLSLLFYLNRKKIAAGLMLGLVFLFYPTYGIAFSLVVFLYELLAVLEKRESTGALIKNLIPAYFIAFIFTIHWLLPSLQRPYYYKVSVFIFESLPTINIFVGLFFSIAFAIYYFTKKSLVPKKYALVSVIFLLVLFILKQFYEISLRSILFRSWLQEMNIFVLVKAVSNYSLLIDSAMIILGILAVLWISKKNVDINQKFLVVWILALVILSGISPDTLLRTLYTGRQAALLLFPLSVMASAGINEFSKKVKGSPYLVVGIIILLSLPSLIGYNLWLQKSVRESGISGFFSKDEYDAIKFLSSQENGNVMSSARFGSYVPYYTGKKTLLFTGRVYEGYLDEVNNDYKKFYTGSDAERIAIINKYEIKYVVFGSEEKSLSRFDPDSAHYLKKAFDKETKIYEVIQ